jgi:hypothetical protein
MYTHIISCFLGYIYLLLEMLCPYSLLNIPCLLNVTIMFELLYKFEDNYWSSIVGNVIHCGHTCVHHRVHCAVWFFTHHIPT